MGGAWFGALYGFRGVPAVHVEPLEYSIRLRNAGLDLFKLAYPEERVSDEMMRALGIHERP